MISTEKLHAIDPHAWDVHPGDNKVFAREELHEANNVRSEMAGIALASEKDLLKGTGKHRMSDDEVASMPYNWRNPQGKRAKRQPGE